MPLLSHREKPVDGEFPLPRFTYTLSTEDDERVIEIGFNAERELVELGDSGWRRIDHDRFTTRASVLVTWPGGFTEVLPLTRWQRRVLTERELFDSLLTGIAYGLPPCEVLALVLPNPVRPPVTLPAAQLCSLGHN